MDQVEHVSGAAMDRRVVRPGAKRRRLAIRVGIALALVIMLVLGWRALPGAQSLSVDGDALQTGTVVHAPFRDYVPLRAEVAPLTTVFVTAISGGQVSALIAQDGMRVEAGQPLARLSNPTLELEVATRSADIAGQLSNTSAQRLSVQRNRLDRARDLADANNALLKARDELGRKRILFGKGIVNRAAVTPLEEEVAYQQGRVTTLAQGQHEENATLADQAARIGDTQNELRQSLAMVRHSLDALTLRAPVAGRLTAFTLQPGQTLKPGDPVGQVDSEGHWKLVADVDQFYLSRVRTGLAAMAEIDGRSVPLHVLKVLPQVTDGRFRVELGFDGAAPTGLNRGQTTDVRLTLGADRPAVIAPAGGWLDGGGTMAFVLDAAGTRATRRAVQIGRRNPDQIEIASGLAPGERIVTGSVAAYTAYQTLVIR